MSTTATQPFTIDLENLALCIEEEWGEEPSLTEGNIAGRISTLVEDGWNYKAFAVADDAPAGLHFGCYPIDEEDDSSVLLTIRCGPPEDFIQVSHYQVETKRLVWDDSQTVADVLQAVVERVSELYQPLLDLLDGRARRIASETQR